MDVDCGNLKRLPPTRPHRHVPTARCMARQILATRATDKRGAGRVLAEDDKDRRIGETQRHKGFQCAGSGGFEPPSPGLGNPSEGSEDEGESPEIET